ncbi:MAG: adenylate cyclase, partial [Gammaproteobacteria bacterium]|nr:adenylate cyclase [Gammaproteobacteria bacterium]
KTRYFIEDGKHTWEVDVFSGENEGLVVAEIELQDPDEALDLPDWVGTEVSDDPRYYNVCLIRNPYRSWAN